MSARPAGSTTRGRRVALGVSLAALAACDRTPRDAPPPTPAFAAPVDSLPPPAPSELVIPVAYDLDPAVAALERAVPRTFGDMDDRKAVPGRERLSVAFAAERSPFTVTIRGTTATIGSIVTYRARGWYDPKFGPTVSGSCGLGGDSAPRLRIALSTTVRLDADWQLHPRSRVAAVVPASLTERDRCQVTIVKYDVTERVVDVVRSRLAGKAAVVDARVADTDVRQRVERWWGLLQQPIRIRDGLWLEIRPADVRLGRLSAEDGALIARLGLTANPRIVSGNRPLHQATALPPLGTTATAGVEAAPGLRIRLDAEMDYADASRILAPRLVGRSFSRGDQRVTVRAATLGGAPGGRVVLRVRVAGATDGEVRFIGRPVYDVASGELRVPDLDFDVASDNVVVRGLDWLKHEDLRDTLRARAQWPAAALVDRARVKLEQALNRDLTTGVTLSAQVPTARVVAVLAGPTAVVLRAEATGDAALRVNRAPGSRPAAPKAPRVATGRPSG